MTTFRALQSIVMIVVIAGCVSDETRMMAGTCEKILVQEDPSEVDAFLRKAEAKLASLNKPPNAFTKLVRDMQDPDARAHKPALEHCVLLLKMHRKPRDFG